MGAVYDEMAGYSDDVAFGPVIPPSQAVGHVEAMAETELSRDAAQDGMERRQRKLLLVE